MNDENLIPNSKRSPSELREQTRKGGIRSGEVRRLKKRGRELLLELLAMSQDNPKVKQDLSKFGVNERDLTNEVMMHLRQVDKAINRADTYAYNSVLKAAGILTDDVNLSTPDTSINITVGSQAAADGLARLMKTGGKPRDPEDE